MDAMNRRAFLKALLVATAALPLVPHLGRKPDASDFPDWNYIDLPRESGDITALVPYHDGSLLVFTQRALYRIDCVDGPFRFDGRRFRAMAIEDAVVTKQRYL